MSAVAINAAKFTVSILSSTTGSQACIVVIKGRLEIGWYTAIQ